MKPFNRLFPAISILLMTLLSTGSLYAQGWMNSYSPDFHMRLNSYFQLEDSTYWVSGANLGTNTQTRTMRISPQGSVLQVFDYDSISAGFTQSHITSDKGLALLGNGIHDSTNPDVKRRSVIRIDSNGNKLWRKDVHVNVNPTSSVQGNMDIDTTDDNGFIVGMNPHDTTLNQKVVLLKRLDEIGNTLWERTYYDTVPGAKVAEVVNSKDGGFIVQVIGFQNAYNYRSKIFKIDGNGDFMWEYTPGYNVNWQGLQAAWVDPIISNDNNILISGTDTGSANIPYIGKLDQNGNELWVKTYPPLPDSSSMTSSIVELDAETFAAATYNFQKSSQSNERFGFMKLDTAGNIFNFKYLPTANLGANLALMPAELKKTADDGFIFGGYMSHNNPNQHHGFLIKMDSTGQVYPNTISGHTFYDRDSNCTRAPSEEWLNQKIISLTNSTDTFRVATHDSGYYSLGVNSGTYDVAINPIAPYWKQVSCNPGQITIPPETDTSVSFGFDATSELPFITIDGHMRSRVCASNTYTIQYCNDGPGTFYGAIQVRLDSILQVDSASIPIANQSGNTLTFAETNGLAITECKTFEVYYSVPCDQDLTLNTVCIDAHAYSDTVAPPPQWDQSNLQMTAQHNTSTDSVEFRLSNTGSGDMDDPEPIIVIEDNVIMMQNQVELDTGEQRLYKMPANGATWRATAEQTPHNPYSRFTTAAIEGAGTNQNNTHSTGYFTQFPINGFYGFDDKACSPILNSFDPNRKTVIPSGAGPNNLIDSTTRLEYTLEFQNTGNDTAYNVYIIDTLPPHLNPHTIDPGVSSHDYDFEFLSSNVVRFSFDAIYLPDSGANLSASKGFVNFQIEQKPNNPNGTVIDNRVGIYFDYNDPVMTNKATVQVGEFKISGVKTFVDHNDVSIKAWPNPFTAQAKIQVKGGSYQQLELAIYNISGELVQKQQMRGSNTFTIDGADFNNGFYIFEVVADGAVIGKGKIMSTQ